MRLMMLSLSELCYRHLPRNRPGMLAGGQGFQPLAPGIADQYDQYQAVSYSPNISFRPVGIATPGH
jgi:hypothetical protein